MNVNKITEEFGDLFVYKLNVDFQKKVTELEFGNYFEDNSKPIKKMIFNDIIWQEFSDFDFNNIFNTIEINYDFESFFKNHIEYFRRMKNYINDEKLMEIKSPNLLYYSFIQTCGLNCFVISKSEIKIEFF